MHKHGIFARILCMTETAMVTTTAFFEMPSTEADSLPGEIRDGEPVYRDIRFNQTHRHGR